MREEGVGDVQRNRIGEDTVGYAMMEVVRTALGFAGARDPARRIADPAAVTLHANNRGPEGAPVPHPHAILRQKDEDQLSCVCNSWSSTRSSPWG